MWKVFFKTHSDYHLVTMCEDTKSDSHEGDVCVCGEYLQQKWMWVCGYFENLVGTKQLSNDSQQFTMVHITALKYIFHVLSLRM